MYAINGAAMPTLADPCVPAHPHAPSQPLRTTHTAPTHACAMHTAPTRACTPPTAQVLVDEAFTVYFTGSAITGAVIAYRERDESACSPSAEVTVLVSLLLLLVVWCAHRRPWLRNRCMLLVRLLYIANSTHFLPSCASREVGGGRRQTRSINLDICLYSGGRVGLGGVYVV